MTARWTLLPIILSMALGTAQAQTDRQARLAYRFVPGQVTQEQARVTGELRVVSGSTSTPITFDAVTLLTRRVVAVSPAGEGTMTIHLDSTVARLTADGQTLLTLQDQTSIATLADGVPLTPVGEAPKEMKVRIGATGLMSAVSGAGDDPVSKLLSAMPASALAFPDRSATVGERWRNTTRRVSPPSGEVGGIALNIPDMAVSSESELRSLQSEQGRLVATIVTTIEGTSKDGASEEHATITSRFDVEAGQMIETVGDLSVNLTLSERGTPAGSKSEGQITGRIHFTTTVLSSRIAAADTTPATPLTRVRPTQPGETPPPLPPTITIPSSPAVTIAPPPPPPPSLEAVAPPPQGFEPLGPDYHGWGLSGGETLRLLASPDSEECRSQCEHEAEACKAYNWVKPGGYKAGDPPACYLMRSYQSASPSPCCVSATRGPFPR